ncbi:MAG: CPBP family intramembrane metalloprotease [Flavobacteriales bacterium]|nr:CPBP family intramembrane metalloprotease [Flavobacteriales bacterium]
MLKKYQLCSFFILSFAISWAIWSPLWLEALGVDVAWRLPLHHAWGSLGPISAAFIVTAVNHGKSGVISLIRSIVSFKSWRWILIAMGIPLVLFLIAWFIENAGSPVVYLSDIGHSSEHPEWGVATFFLYNVLTFGLGEEVGWRGFALPQLQRRHKALMASLVLSVFWAIWHWPLFLYRPGYTDMGAGAIFGWFISLVLGSVILTWLFNGSKGSLLTVIVFHAAIDVAFTNAATNDEVITLLGAFITVLGIAVLIYPGKGGLHKTPRITDMRLSEKDVCV